MTLHGIYQTLLYSIFFLAALMFISSFFLTTPYGRFKTSNSRWDFPPVTGWLLLESPCLFAASLTFFLSGGQSTALVPLIFICLWQTHYFYRAVIFPLRVSRGSKPVALSGILAGIFFNSVNGFLNGYAFAHSPHLLDESWLTTPYFIFGVGFMVIGVSINIYSDNILKKLRKPGETGYKIPRGGLYRWISAPNYFGEMMEWGGLALASATPASLAFFFFTIGNLFPRAIAHHRWYREKFNDYPDERKAIIPYLI